MGSTSNKANFVVAEPARTSCDYYGRVLDSIGKLRFVGIGTRRGIAGISMERTRLKPAVGLITTITARVFSPFRGESIRFRLHPWLDHWVKGMLQPGDNVVSSYGYANECFKYARAHGGKTFLDGGNSHPDNFWTILSEELRRWNSPYPPVSRYHYERSLAMMEHVDYVLAPSSFVANSFLNRGFKPEQILKNYFPVDLSCFTPSTSPRPKDRPLTIISTGRPSIRKGAPYMLEAFDIIHRQHPSARFLLSMPVEDNAREVVAKYQHLPIDWSPSVPHAQLAERLRSADIFVLPSLEDGFALTVAEALGCGLPVITTPNTGASDLVESDRSGEVVPIRDSRAIADAILKWGDRVMKSDNPSVRRIDPELLTPERFARVFTEQLASIGLLP